jgi:ABC-type antimicrobial peptide transport system permease subunit
MSYSVRRRTREIGIRMALGARSGAVLGMVMRQGAWLTGAGLAAGMALAWALSRFAQSQLYGVSATDGLTFAAVPVALAVVAMIAVALPARRAARIDPIEAVREE